MKKFKISFVLALLIAMVGCTDSSLVEDTNPLVEPEGRSSEEILEVPTTVDILITFPRNSDKFQFLRNYGKQLGVLAVWNCPTDPDTQKWVINYVNLEDFGVLISSIFDSVELLDSDTTSNGAGGNEPYAAYSVGNSTSPSSGGAEYYEYYRFVYNGKC